MPLQLLLLDLGLCKLDLYIWISLFSSLLKAPILIVNCFLKQLLIVLLL